jgi:zinc protease
MKASRRDQILQKLNQAAPEHGAIQFLGSTPFGQALTIERYKLKNGLQILLTKDPSAPVIAYHTWFRVGSRHERPGKTGLAHLFEHLMFGAMEGLPPGQFDHRMEALGADNNASTWLDFTQYQEAFPRQHLGKIVRLEALRMHRLTIGEPELVAEKDVVMNERRFRVDDDVDGTIDEALWKTAFREHPYRWPTIGWMEDIVAFEVKDCMDFYRTYYSPGNACLVLVGDFSEEGALGAISQAYGTLPPAVLPIEQPAVEPAQTEERRLELFLPTTTEKLTVGYRGPSLGDPEHVWLTLLMEVLAGGPASRLKKRLIRDEPAASDIRASVGPHRDPSLIEFSFAARQDVSAERLLAVLDEEIARLHQAPPSQEELERAQARSKLHLLSGLESADGKASTIGFYETVVRRPSAAFERLELMSRAELGDLWRVARKYLRPQERTVIIAKLKAAGGQS